MLLVTEKGVQSIRDIPEEIMKLTVHGDQARLQQVLTDFLPNYIVHYAPSPDGWVEIQLRPSMKPLSAGVTIVYVELSKIKNMAALEIPDVVMADGEQDYMEIDLGVQDYGHLISQGAESPVFCSSQFMSPSSHQRDLDCCTPFAIGGALGALVALDNIQDGHGGQDAFDFSKQEFLDCVPMKKKEGISFKRGYNYVREYGLHLEKDYPYQRDYLDCRCSLLRERPKFTFSDIVYVHPNDVVENLKRRPLTASMVVYESFKRFYSPRLSVNDLMRTYSPGPNEVPRISATTKLEAMHAVLVVGYGYENHELYYIIKNSWGVNGYARVPARLLSAFSYPVGSTYMVNW